MKKNLDQTRPSITPIIKENIFHSLVILFFLLADVSEEIACFAVVQKAMQHLEQNFATFRRFSLISIFQK